MFLNQLNQVLVGVKNRVDQSAAPDAQNNKSFDPPRSSIRGTVYSDAFITEKYATPSPTGMKGLINQGATCYLNSFLQTLFMTPDFRKVWYHYFTYALMFNCA